ncbi:helix-turn-helix domain-containing protein [Roseivivax sp. CAU 1753]
METMMATPPFPHSETPLARFLRQRILELSAKKTQREIAVEAGFTNPNFLSMLKNGQNKLPLDRVLDLAKALETDPARLFLLALCQRSNESTYETVKQIFGTVVTRNEVVWLEALREASGGTDPRPTARALAALRAIFGK